jgi:hypothetical protein
MLRAGPSDVTYRRATPDDRQQIRSFSLGLGVPSYVGAAQLSVTHHAANKIDSDEHVVLVAERECQVVAVLCMSFDPDTAGTAVIDILAVLPAHQREYIGSNLKARAIATAAHLGYTRVTSSVDVENTPMRACNHRLAAVTEPKPDDPTDLLTVIAIYVADSTVQPTGRIPHL